MASRGEEEKESESRRGDMTGVEEGSAVGKGSSDSPLGPVRGYESSAGVANSTKSITRTLSLVSAGGLSFESLFCTL